jgi:hypothetical protein
LQLSDTARYKLQPHLIVNRDGFGQELARAQCLIAKVILRDRQNLPTLKGDISSTFII